MVCSKINLRCSITYKLHQFNINKINLSRNEFLILKWVTFRIISEVFSQTKIENHICAQILLCLSFYGRTGLVCRIHGNKRCRLLILDEGQLYMTQRSGTRRTLFKSSLRDRAIHLWFQLFGCFLKGFKPLFSSQGEAKLN